MQSGKIIFLIFNFVSVLNYVSAGWDQGGGVDTSYYKPGVRVKWGSPSNTLGRGKDFNFDIALTASEAESRDGWVQIQLPDGTPYSSMLSMRCPANDLTFCAFYDEYDDYAGFQLSVQINSIKNPVPDDQRNIGAILWSAPEIEGCEAQDYWAYQLFIVDDECLKKTKKERDALRASKNTLLYNDGFWISDIDDYSNTKLRKVGDVETDLPDQDYYRQGCYKGMGRHYFYQLPTRRSCSKTDPWFPLTSSGGNQVHGVGFFLQANVPDPAVGSGQRTWFEHVPSLAIKSVLPDVPRCDVSLAAAGNFRSVHMYFISEPWNIQCTDEADFKALGLDS